MKKLFISLLFLFILSSCSSSSDLKETFYELKIVPTEKITIYFDKNTAHFHLVYLEKHKNKWKQVNGATLYSTGEEKNFVISSNKKPFLYFGTITNPEADKIIVGDTDATLVTYNNNLRLWYYVDFTAKKHLSIYEVVNGKKVLLQP
ncbi:MULTISPECIES: hypothetical protein [Bacillaceae]|uniref:Lipoprotein n=1 Tax=Gottfriedia luciferensis TaxID=178774 RepID=A0ABX2ZNC4_9BACI|nr:MULTISPECIES: hypothetical protein [Bacillaceae]ODG91236.1 hypothetical protein BED47_06120 [Gottfriedia luciferensis]PGZ91907.1 hypothetical protein COE53_11000 [Bacillus sp. AFS029533]SFD53860.1 hypothetical protein SAMN02799633_04065 [Bacillus sp. UNCCL81]